VTAELVQVLDKLERGTPWAPTLADAPPSDDGDERPAAGADAPL